MSTTIMLQSVDEVEMVSSNDIRFAGSTIDLYKSAAHHLKFTGYIAAAPGAVSGSIEVYCNGDDKRIFLTNADNRIPLYYAVGNGAAWVSGTYYTVGTLVWGDDPTVNKYIYRCKVAHSSLANTRPPSGAFWGSYWELRDDLDNGEKYIYINDLE